MILPDDIDFLLLADVIAEVRHGYGRSNALAYGKPESEGKPVIVTVPCVMTAWHAVEPIMEHVIPRLPFVLSVQRLGDQGWRVECRPDTRKIEVRPDAPP